MKVLTAAEMREVDRRTIESGIPGVILMENAAHRVVEFLRERYAPLGRQHVVVLCGKGNNGGDGLAIARLLHVTERPARLDVLLAASPNELSGDAAANLRMLRAAGLSTVAEISDSMRAATLVVDALLGTGLEGPPRDRMAELVAEINGGFPAARVVAVDIPSGLPSDRADCGWSFARADATVTFTAPKIAHALAPNCDRMGELRVGRIGSPEGFLPSGLELTEAADLAALFTPRARNAHKGDFGHVLVVGGAAGKTGAAQMAGLAALRAGAGLVTVASEGGTFPPELMTEELPGRADGKDVVAIGPGLGAHPATIDLIRDLPQPMVIDADALSTLARQWIPLGERVRVLTPHPGEMGRLIGATAAEVQRDRLKAARELARERHCTLVLKGERTIVVFPDGSAAINPTGTPALAKGGSGDILTGMIAGLMAQHPHRWRDAVRAAVWLHGRAGEIAAASSAEPCVIATDLLRALPEAVNELRHAL